MSKRAQQFEVALKRLCREYRIHLNVTGDGDALAIYDLRVTDDPVGADIQDNTTEGRD